MNKLIKKSFFLLLLISIIILLSASFTFATDVYKAQYQVLIMSRDAKNMSNMSNIWIGKGIQKSIEFMVEGLQSFGILNTRQLQSEYKTKYYGVDYYDLGISDLADIGKDYRADYIITYKYNTISDDNFTLELKIFETASESIMKPKDSTGNYSFSISGNTKQVLSIGDKIVDLLIKYHGIELNIYEKSALKRNEFTVYPPATAYWCKGYIAYEMKSYQTAIEYIQRALVYYETFSEALRMLAKLRIMTGDVKTAMKRIKDALASNPSNYRCWKTAGEISQLRGKEQQALTYYNKALELRGNDAEIFIRAAKIYYRNQLYTDAKAWFQKAYNLDPTNLEALEGITEILAYEKDWELAFKYADKLLSMDNDNFTAITVLATVYANQREYAKAINLLIEAVSINGNYMEGHYLLAKLYASYYDETADPLYYKQSIKAIKYCMDSNYKTPLVYIDAAKIYAMGYDGSNAASCVNLAFENGYSNIDKILFDPAFENVMNHPRFTKVVNYWYNKLKNKNGY